MLLPALLHDLLLSVRLAILPRIVLQQQLWRCVGTLIGVVGDDSGGHLVGQLCRGSKWRGVRLRHCFGRVLMVSMEAAQALMVVADGGTGDLRVLLSGRICADEVEAEEGAVTPAHVFSALARTQTRTFHSHSVAFVPHSPFANNRHLASIITSKRAGKWQKKRMHRSRLLLFHTTAMDFLIA